MNCKSNALCAIALLLPFGAHATNGTLTMNAASEYEVADYADLKAVGTGSYALDTTYRLTANIDASPSATENSGAGFLPIGIFTGTFHGTGHVISGLVINRTSLSYAGLFAQIGVGGIVDSLGLIGGSVKGQSYVGGLAGLNSGSIRYSYTTGAATAIAISLGMGQADAYSGGLVGSNEGTISYSYATGGATATAFATGVTQADAYSGGLVGNHYYGAISYSYATGAATATAISLGAMQPNAYSGGLVGENYGGTISYSYWNTETSNNATSAGGTGLTNAQMLQASSFPNWDFSSPWILYEGHTFPLLRSFMTPLTVTAKDTIKVYDGNSFSGGSGVTYSLPGATRIYGTVIDTGSSQGAKTPGTYDIKPGGLYSDQRGYAITFKPGTLTVNAKPLTIHGLIANNKVYDGSADATLSGGVLDTVSGDKVTLVPGTSTFADKNAGTAKAVTASGYSITGPDVLNYTLSAQPTGLVANITAKPLLVTGVSAANKVYEATATAKLSQILTDTLVGDAISLTADTVVFTDKNVGSNKMVMASGFKITGGIDAVNYALLPSQLRIARADITPYPITVTADAKAITQGDSNVALTYTATPLLTSDSWAGELARIAGDTADTYAITQGTLNAGLNYAITFNGADYVIHAKPIEVALLPTRTASQGFFIAHQSGDVLDVTYNTPFAGNVSIDFYSLRGQKMLSVNCGMQNAGAYSANVQTNTMPVGLYTAMLRVNRVSISTIKMVKN